MFNGISYKNKFFALIGLTILFAVIAYTLAFKKTFMIKEEYKKIKSQLEIVDKAPEEIARYEKKMREYNSLLDIDLTENKDAQEILLEEISNYCEEHKMILKEMPRIHISSDQGYEVWTNTVVIGGDFIQLLKLLNNMEKQKVFGTISSVKFHSEENFRSRRRFLTMTMYIQNIKHV